MPEYNSSNITIGIFGGGQLGDMLSTAAHKLGYKTVIFTDNVNCPAIDNCSDYIISDYRNEQSLFEFAKKIDVATLEFENIPTESVDFIAKYCPIFPDSRVLNIAKNRLLEKSFMADNQINTAEFYEITNKNNFLENLKKLNYKAILKTNQMGYDGKGQHLINNENEIPDLSFDKEKYILEEFIPFEREISVMIGRDQSGKVSCYEPLENKHKNGILDTSSYPANISQETSKNSKIIAQKIIENLNMTGLLGVEFFVLKSGKLLVNEIAPRPHNSGHFSMDGCNTSQFEQLIRIVCQLPLGDVTFDKKGYMKNLIGNDVLNIEKLIKDKLHRTYLYNKKEIKPGRKMGHINFINND